MRLRLNPCAPTPEDFAIILRCVVQSTERTLRVEFLYRHADRRDADLMLYCLRCRQAIGTAHCLRRTGGPYLVLGGVLS